MPATTPDLADIRSEWQSTRARIAGLAQRRPASDPDLVAARARLAELRPYLDGPRDALKRDDAAARLTAHAMRVAAQAPPLTDEQIARISAILAGRS